MKAIKFLSMLLMMVAMSVSFSSCDKEPPVHEPEDPEFSLPGSRWTFSEKEDIDGVKYTIDYTLTFSTSTATYQIKMTVEDGTQTTTSSDYIDYNYVYSNGLVVLSPQKAGYAYLEGTIQSDIKMTVVNTSNNKTVGVFYKQ